MKYFANYALVWIRATDRWLRDRPSSIDAALSYYYIGAKSADVLDDRALVKMFRGAGLCPW
jgi:hypothetical protein